MEFVHESVERNFRLETAKSLVKSDVYGILTHAYLSTVGVLVSTPQSGVFLYYAAHTLGTFKIVPLALIWGRRQLYIQWRDVLLVTMRLLDTMSSLIIISLLHGPRFPPDLTLTQFYIRAFFAWFGAFFGAVSKQPPANLNFILTLLHLVGRIALSNMYIQVLAPHYGKMAPAVRWLEERGLGSWTEAGLLQCATLSLDVLLGMVLPCWINYRRELHLRQHWRRKAGLEGSPQGAIGATWPHYIGCCIVLPVAAFVLSLDPALLPFLF